MEQNTVVLSLETYEKLREIEKAFMNKSTCFRIAHYVDEHEIFFVEEKEDVIKKFKDKLLSLEESKASLELEVKKYWEEKFQFEKTFRDLKTKIEDLEKENLDLLNKSLKTKIKKFRIKWK